MVELVTIGGIPPGTGAECRQCDKDVREFCWLFRACELGLTDLGGLARKPKKRKKNG